MPITKRLSAFIFKRKLFPKVLALEKQSKNYVEKLELF